ncbi:FAD binding domain-containing protein [Apiospora rasikravindrae]|uniref:FAD binding domain-containing protein n=1 Tax=Apiospora rasikravindrae TaxID=990691 RepID=A0ABR1RWJ8_9PEZI
MAKKLSASQLQDLQGGLGLEVEILTGEGSGDRFQELAQGWTNIGRETPGAIVMPQTEKQIQKTVQWAVQSSVPFVAKSGGHSEWSSIGEQGIVINLKKFSGIEVDAVDQTARLKGSVLAKDVAVALAATGSFTALGNGNTVGAIPYFLGGGSSITNSITGYGSDQIIAARMIDAKGRLVEVNEEEEPGLLYAIRGAGQFFGLVTELTVRTTPLSALGNDRGVIWVGAFVFPLERAKEVAEVMKSLMDDASRATAGLIMTMAPPPARKPALIISARYTGNPDDAQTPYKPLYDLQPLVAKGGPVPIQNASDARETLCAKGDFKRFGIVGLKRFDIDRFLETIEVWKAMVKQCPDAINTAFNFQWDSRPPKTPEFESAMSLHDTRYWQNNLIWHTDPAAREQVDMFNDECIRIMRGPDRSEYADFQNGTRTGPLELRFRGPGKLDKLKALKLKWDPVGVFTRQLLD